tara:strand:- start:172 stop:366 length:195 start_codon:yes stop_codon:yes gene_type:complete
LIKKGQKTATWEPFLIKFIFYTQKPTEPVLNLGGHQHLVQGIVKNSHFLAIAKPLAPDAGVRQE